MLEVNSNPVNSATRQRQIGIINENSKSNRSQNQIEMAVHSSILQESSEVLLQVQCRIRMTAACLLNFYLREQ
jgi:hypothetical protein